MNCFLSTTGQGLMRALRDASAQWQVEHVLQGQVVNCLAQDPLQAGVIYAGTQENGILCSRDYGSSWAPAGLAGQTIKAISASRSQPGLVFAGSRPARLYVSRDQGQHWQELPAFRKIFSRWFWFSPASAPFSAYVQGIALSPTQPEVIVAGIEFGAVVRSTDGGQTWQDHRPGALRDCHSIQFHVSNGDWIYEAGGTGAGVAISQNGGRTWQQPRAGLDRHYGWACAADPRQPEICYASIAPSPAQAHNSGKANAYIFRTNGDGVWQKLGGGLPQPLVHMPYALLTDPDVPGHVYAGLSSGDVWWSQNYGDTWEPLPFNLRAIQHCLILI
jgi:hypothetical protein